MQSALALPMPPALPALLAPPLPLTPEPTSPIVTAAPMLVFGLDQGGRSHAACFTGHAAESVEHAADLMDLFCVAADTDALRDLGVRLPVGRLFGSGRGFVPYCKASIYEQLLAASGLTDNPRPLKAAEAGSGSGSGHAVAQADRALATHLRRGSVPRPRATTHRLASAPSCSRRMRKTAATIRPRS